MRCRSGKARWKTKTKWRRRPPDAAPPSRPERVGVPLARTREMSAIKVNGEDLACCLRATAPRAAIPIRGRVAAGKGRR
jgi:hypothetical protein